MKTAHALPALALAACAAAPPPMKAPESLAAAETAFAAHSVRENMRPAFLANFADDGVFVRGGWINSNAYLATRENPPIVLDWRPVYVESAASGDLGLSTGPTRLTSTAKPGDPPSFGQYVSIWRRAGQGPWKVEVDLGINHPTPALWDQPLVAVTSGSMRGSRGGESGVRLAEEKFTHESSRGGARSAYESLASEHFRFYRAGSAPAIGRPAALAAPGMVADRLVWHADRVETSQAGDFGYTRGSYARAEAPEKVLGHYLRVWRLEGGQWRVALDVTNVLATPGS